MKSTSFVCKPDGFLNLVLDDDHGIAIWLSSPSQGMVGLALAREDVELLSDDLLEWLHETSTETSTDEYEHDAESNSIWHKELHKRLRGTMA